MAVRGGFPLPPPCGCALGYRAARLGCSLSPLRLRVVHVLRFGGLPLLFLPLSARWGCARPPWGVPLALLPARGLSALLGGRSPGHLPLMTARLGRVLPCWGVPLRPLAARRWRALLGEGLPPPSPPGWPYALSARVWSGGLCCSPPSSCLSHAWSARCPISASVNVSALPDSAVSLVAPLHSPLALGPALARTPSGASDASKL